MDQKQDGIDVQSAKDKRQAMQDDDPILGLINAFYEQMQQGVKPADCEYPGDQFHMLVMEVQRLRREAGGETGNQSADEMLETAWMRYQQANDSNTAVLRAILRRLGSDHAKFQQLQSTIDTLTASIHDSFIENGLEFTLLENQNDGKIRHTNVRKCSFCKGQGRRFFAKTDDSSTRGDEITSAAYILKSKSERDRFVMQTCVHCEGTGATVPPSKKCHKCKGEGQLAQPRGMRNAPMVTLDKAKPPVNFNLHKCDHCNGEGESPV